MFPSQLDLCRRHLELIFSQLNVSGLRLAPNQDMVNLDTARTERAAQFDNSPAHAAGAVDLDAVPEVEENGRFFLLLLGHRPLLEKEIVAVH